MRGRYVMKMILIVALALSTSCGNGNKPVAVNHEPMERTLIIGSAESPDPVLAKVRELEKAGTVEDVVVMESFPVQIRLRASRKVIDELNAIPRVGGVR